MSVAEQHPRRAFFGDLATVLGSIAVTHLLQKDGLLADDSDDGSPIRPRVDPGNPFAARDAHVDAAAKNVIVVFCSGACSHLDTFDYKPELIRRHGQAMPGADGLLTFQGQQGNLTKSPWAFKPRGECGKMVSDLVPQLGDMADDICFLHGMTSKTNTHGPGENFMSTGSTLDGFPSMGAWVSYALGSENQNLPGFIAMKPGGYPGNGGTQNWQSAFLPGAHQGTYINTQHTQIEKLIENTTNQRVSRDEQSRQLELLRELNEVHRQQIDNNSQVDARIQSFELASRMQLEATDAFDVSQEPQSIHRMYGAGTEARQLMIARRLVERGVRFVQAWVGSDWDHHQNLEQSHRSMAKQCDQVIGALLKDLKLRGMLEDTLVIWGGEFGRTPTVEVPMGLPNNLHGNGRDHNHHGFTTWLAGGGVKGGYVHGATDEFGFKAVDKKVHVHDLHATILHLLGFDHTRLTYRHASRDFRLTDVFGDVVHDLIA
ncbi:MAG: DUF1501 domain-containing protein [Planctomicrobium sp.]|nr:DUF1501 domain-containing protein [Planctomicrobium sp.]